MNRVKLTATLMLPILLLFAVLYVGITAAGTLDYALISREKWYQSDWVHPNAQVAELTRWVYLVMWMLPVACGLAGVAAAFRMLILVRDGVLFDTRISRGFRWVGLGVATSGAADLMANFLTPMILSWHNPGGPSSPSFYFNSEAGGLILCGGGFFLVGWIMSEAIRISDENEGFV